MKRADEPGALEEHEKPAEGAEELPERSSEELPERRRRRARWTPPVLEECQAVTRDAWSLVLLGWF